VAGLPQAVHAVGLLKRRLLSAYLHQRLQLACMRVRLACLEQWIRLGMPRGFGAATCNNVHVC